MVFINEDAQKTAHSSGVNYIMMTIIYKLLAHSLVSWRQREREGEGENREGGQREIDRESR